MTYKTILLHCNDKARLDGILAPALEVASALEHISPGCPSPRLQSSFPPACPSTLEVDDHCKAYRRNNPEMRAAFEAACSARNVASVWKEVDAGTHSVAHVVVGQARSADLAIAAQTAPDWPGSRRLDIADRLVLESGRPVLIVPSGANIRAAGA